MINVYSKPHCQQCTATYRKLKALGLPFNSIDVTEDADALAFIRTLGYQQAPVVVVREGGDIKKHWSGFRPDLLKKETQND
ncbi:MAG: NrdH-redoxin [Porphyromonadaceae bacterium]|nr:NrdH-redoxin [Porphyromonadaceae bacterium]